MNLEIAPTHAPKNERFFFAPRSLCITALVATAAWDVHSQLKSVNFRPEAAMWEKMGTTLAYAAKVVALTQDYGNWLAYWGSHSRRNWPYAEDTNYHELRGKSFKIGELFSDLTQNKPYFLVTDFAELDRRLPIYRQAEGNVI